MDESLRFLPSFLPEDRGSDSWQVVDAQFDTVIARLYSCMQSEARIMLEPAAELLRILAVYRRKRRVLGDRKNI